MNQYHTDHIPFQNAIKLEANYKNVTKKGTYVWKFKNTSKLLMNQNRNHNRNLKISRAEWWGTNGPSKWGKKVLQRKNNR